MLTGFGIRIYLHPRKGWDFLFFFTRKFCLSLTLTFLYCLKFFESSLNSSSCPKLTPIIGRNDPLKGRCLKRRSFFLQMFWIGPKVCGPNSPNANIFGWSSYIVLSISTGHQPQHNPWPLNTIFSHPFRFHNRYSCIYF